MVAEIGISVKIMLVDVLNCIYLGGLKRLWKAIVWEFTAADAWYVGPDLTQEEKGKFVGSFVGPWVIRLLQIVCKA